MKTFNEEQTAAVSSALWTLSDLPNHPGTEHVQNMNKAGATPDQPLDGMAVRVLTDAIARTGFFDPYPKKHKEPRETKDDDVVQVVVTIDKYTGDPLRAALQYVKASMLQTYATEFGAEAEVHYSDHSIYYVVEFKATDHNATSFIHKLANAGCVDIHIDTFDEVTEGIIDSAHHGLFRVCKTKNRWE